MAQQARTAFTGSASLRSAGDSLPKTSPFRNIVDLALDAVRLFVLSLESEYLPETAGLPLQAGPLAAVFSIAQSRLDPPF
jgi:hypothetical protein